MGYIPIENNDNPKNIENVIDSGIKTDEKVKIE
jgi:hypothetical protein